MMSKIRQFSYRVIFCLFLVAPIVAQAEDIIFLGNSITLHPPSSSISWSGNWGMAASSQKNDYVHTVKNLLEASEGKKYSVTSLNISAFEREPVARLNWALGLVTQSSYNKAVVFLGDNVIPGAEPWQQFLTSYSTLLNVLKNSNAEVYCVSLWWANDARNADLQRVCAASGGFFVKLPAETQTPLARANSENRPEKGGVGAHPGDRGMSFIGKAIYSAMKLKR